MASDDDQQEDSTLSGAIEFLKKSFRDPALQRLYRSYSVRQKRAGLPCFLFASILYNIYIIAIPDGQDIVGQGIAAILLGFNLAFLAWCWRDVPKSMFWAAAPHLAWHLANAQLILNLFFKRNDVTGRESLGWVLLFIYLVYVTLPLRLRYCVMLSLGTVASYLATILGLAKSEEHMIYEMAVNSILLIGTNLMGLLSFFVFDNQERRAFLETRQSLEMKLVIEEESAEQEHLLLSVLPEHVAVKMRQDLGSSKDSQFKKIYMSRHENVSILYADIVGFTAISSTYSASELVKILNELFARFDRLSEKYQQLRIKILGDCYYCISGAPRERPDHAVLSVHMGLSMVKAIKYVQQKTNSPVDMRVGIHTGAVLAGVLGQRQWQFDVYSKDVELANKMESSGLPGRVHISQKTLSFLNGEFEVEPAFGEKREEVLRMSGIKTFFIVRTLKPFQPSTGEVRNGMITDDMNINGDVGSEKKEGDNDSMCTSPLDENHAINNETGVRNDTEDFKRQLRHELMNRNGHNDLSKHTKRCTLAFSDPKKEDDYQHSHDVFAAISVSGCLLTFVCLCLSQIIILPTKITSLGPYISVAGLTIGFICLNAEFKRRNCLCFKKCGKKINSYTWARRLLAGIMILLLAYENIDNMALCIPPHENPNCTISAIPNCACQYPSYYSYFCVTILIAVSIVAQLSYLVKSALLLLIAIGHSIMNVLFIGFNLDCEEAANHREWPNIISGKYSLCGLLFAATLSLMALGRYIEKASRVLFLWKTVVEEQREQASDMRRRNEALVYNILPPHVAAHFMGTRKRQHEELYSQSYGEVGVLFASMPNFSDFYSEESVNNQGLECLRFLNEVISDFDALLEKPRFQDIIKIKTIGSTYMAASGLNPSILFKPEDPITVVWEHLCILVEFAFELKKALQGINEQSFNHFVLKMGINHGPITAGVIGARKPHYDIWGNTVNVASRMESTGKAGAIQVTEETMKILVHFGYEFEQRGMVTVKGKGQLMTYYLIGKSSNPIRIEDVPIKVNPGGGLGNGTVSMDTSPILLDAPGVMQGLSETQLIENY